MKESDGRQSADDIYSILLGAEREAVIERIELLVVVFARELI